MGLSSPDASFLAWARARPTFSATERTEIRERFDVGVQIQSDRAHAAQAPAPALATATLARSDGAIGPGAVRFQEDGGKVLIQARLSGLSPGDHGVTINDGGDCDAAEERPAGHWNPTNSQHGSIGSSTRHVGDFGNLTVDADGNASLAVVTDSFRVIGEESVVGKTLVIHARPDDGTTQPSGNSGPAVACGVILGSEQRLAATSTTRRRSNVVR